MTIPLCTQAASLRGDGLWFRYRDRWILRGVDIGVNPGEVVGLWGPSGSGKSTLAHLLTGRLHPERGTVSMPERPAGTPRSAQLVIQRAVTALNPRHKVASILAEASDDPSPVIDNGLIDEAWLRAFPNELSGGELQRVNLARAWLVNPDFIVADEMTASLDAITQVTIWGLLLDGVRNEGFGVLAVSHDMPLLERVADRLVDFEQINPPDA